MAKEKTKAAKQLGAKVSKVKRNRGKKQPRRWAQKLEGSIINTRRKINCDDAGKAFPQDKPKATN